MKRVLVCKPVCKGRVLGEGEEQQLWDRGLMCLAVRAVFYLQRVLRKPGIAVNPRKELTAQV